MRAINLPDEFLPNLKQQILENIYFSEDLINCTVDKPLFVSEKGSTNIIPIQQCFSNWGFVWFYWMIIAYIHVYPNYEFWTHASEFPNYLVSTEG